MSKKLQHTKSIEPVQKIVLPHNNQMSKCTKERKKENITNSKGKRSSNLQRQTYEDYTRILTNNIQKILVKCPVDPKRTPMPALATI